MKKLFKVLLVLCLCMSLCACKKSVSIDSLLGSYQDSTSQRAMAEISKVDDNTVNIDIRWSNSAISYEEWIIKAKIDGSKLTYAKNDLTHFNNDNGNQTTINDVKEGYFEVKDGKVLWSGSGDEYLSTCVFEKLQ